MRKSVAVRSSHPGYQDFMGNTLPGFAMTSVPKRGKAGMQYQKTFFWLFFNFPRRGVSLCSTVFSYKRYQFFHPYDSEKKISP